MSVSSKLLHSPSHLYSITISITCRWCILYCLLLSVPTYPLVLSHSPSLPLLPSLPLFLSLSLHWYVPLPSSSLFLPWSRPLQSVRSGEWKGYSGKAISDVVNIGIGGSDLVRATIYTTYCKGDKTFDHFVNIDASSCCHLSTVPVPPLSRSSPSPPPHPLTVGTSHGDRSPQDLR